MAAIDVIVTDNRIGESGVISFLNAIQYQDVMLLTSTNLTKTAPTGLMRLLLQVSLSLSLYNCGVMRILAAFQIIIETFVNL